MKNLLTVFFISILCLGFVSCQDRQYQLYGGTYQYTDKGGFRQDPECLGWKMIQDTNIYHKEIVLNKRHKFKYVFTVNDSLVDALSGKWEVKSDSLILDFSSDNIKGLKKMIKERDYFSLRGIYIKAFCRINDDQIKLGSWYNWFGERSIYVDKPLTKVMPDPNNEQ